MRLIFYNNWHNGDLHYTREFVKDIIKKTKFNEYLYLHRNNPKVLKDIPVIYGAPNEYCLNHNIILQKNDDIYINTWIGVVTLLQEFGTNPCWLEFYYTLFQHIFDNLSINIEDIKYYIPDIDYEQYDISNIKEYLLKDKIRVLVCNGETLSYQSGIFDFNYIINKLSDDFSHIDFICTDDKNKLTKDNVLYTSDIIKAESGDLNEISYLSTFCDTIIGKSSGPYTFTIVKKNLSDLNKTFVFLCNNLHDGLFYYNNICNKVWINNYDNDFIYNMIKNELNKRHQIFPTDFNVYVTDNKIHITPNKDINKKVSIDFVYNGSMVWNYTRDSYLAGNNFWTMPFRDYDATVHNMVVKFYVGNKRFLFEKVIL